MAYETLIWERRGPVGRLTLNRPESLNAWTTQFGHELLDVISGEAADGAVRAVLITGAGRGFSSGADLRAGFDPADDGMPDIHKELHDVYHPAILGIRRLPKPVVAAVNGPAVGIGCSLALACDRVMAAESAFFALAVGRARAMQMALLGERVPAGQALNWGLVNWVYPDAELLSHADELVSRLAAGPTRSYAASKQALNRFIYRDLDAQLELEAELQHQLGRTSDFAEGVAAFVEKRDPDFRGR